jgi:hypothetical protein
MQKEVIIIDVKTEEGRAELKKLQSGVSDLNTEVVKSNKKAEGSLKNVEKSSNSASKGVKAIGVSLKALGIGLIIAAVAKFTEVLSQNQKIADGFANIMETVSIVFNQVVEAVVSSTGSFTALGKVIDGLITLALTPLKVSFNLIKLGIQEAQLFWEKSFFGGGDEDKIKSLTAEIILTKIEIGKIGEEALNAGKDVVNNFVAGVKSITDISVSAAYEQAKINTQLNKNAKLATALNQGLIEQYDRQAELLRQIRDDSSKSIKERIKANEDLSIVLDKQEKAMLANANTIRLAAQAQFNKNKNDENSIILQEAKNEQAAIEAQITGFKSEQQVNLNSLLKEEKDIKKELELIGKNEIEQAVIGAAQKLQIQTELINREVENEIEKNTLLLAAKKEYDLEIKAINDRIAAALEEERQKEIKAEQERQAERNAIAEQERQQKLTTLDTIRYTAGEESAIGKAAFLIKQLMVLDQMKLDILELSSKANKTVAVASLNAAESGTSVAKGFAASLATLSPVVIAGYALSAGLVVASMIKAVKKAKSTASQFGGGFSSSVSAPSLPAVSAPDFNIVGQSGTNQLAESIGSQEKKPLKAYVVSGDVTTAQAMERNIIASASI